MEDDPGEVGRGDRVEKVDRPWSGISSISEAQSNFFELDAGAKSNWAEHQHV